uniref:Uncharacterized protein n=1 Tax=Bionectria ochroleuca TaxID=29856 RepID=A0A8H7K691_BIOOC
MKGSSAALMFNQFRGLADRNSEDTFSRPAECFQIPHASGPTYVTVAPIRLTDPGSWSKALEAVDQMLWKEETVATARLTRDERMRIREEKALAAKNNAPE